MSKIPLLSLLKDRDRLFYGWVLVIACFFIGTAVIGTRLSFGVFFKPIQDEFLLSRASTSGVAAVYNVLCCVFSILGGWTIDRYGPKVVMFSIALFTGLSLVLSSQTSSLWQLYITYSLLLAIGHGPWYIVTVATMSRWFSKRRGLAMGIASSGAGLGTFIMAPFAAFLIANYSWRIAYLVLGLIAWVVAIPLARLFKRDPREVGALPDGLKLSVADNKPDAAGNSLQSAGLSLLQALKTRSFWLLIVTLVFLASNAFLVLTHIVPHAEDMGFTPGQAASILSVFGGTLIVSRITVGFISDKMGRRLSVILCALLQLGAMVWLLGARQLWQLYLFMGIFGFAYAGLAPTIASLVSHTFGLHRIGSIMGMLDVGFGGGAALGPFIGGFIFDTSGSYADAFKLGAAVVLAATLLIVMVRRETGEPLEGGYSPGRVSP